MQDVANVWVCVMCSVVWCGVVWCVGGGGEVFTLCVCHFWIDVRFPSSTVHLFKMPKIKCAFRNVQQFDISNTRRVHYNNTKHIKVPSRMSFEITMEAEATKK